ncbi:MAG TPA: methyltransferase [Streptosporangiaceae bacterium]|nr:methyltransferase [Streptosporangiaceae bacterium]
MSEQYFTSEPSAAHRRGSVHVLLPDLHLELETDSGVFSPRRLDPGTRLLLDVAPLPPSSGNLLDLGCGYGPLALVLASRAPGASVWAIDVNTRALSLTCANAARAGLHNVTCAPPDDQGIPLKLDLIWSNPPVRIGKNALHELLASWLNRLARGGAAFLVVQRNLGSDSLQRWLADSGFTAERAAARSGYRVLQVSRAGPQTPPPAAGGEAGRGARATQ